MTKNEVDRSFFRRVACLNNIELSMCVPFENLRPADINCD